MQAQQPTTAVAIISTTPTTETCPRISAPINQTSAPMTISPRLKIIFDVFKTTYGANWVNRFNDETNVAIAIKIWGDAIADLSDAQIKKAIGGLGEYPPPPNVFRELALQPDRCPGCGKILGTDGKCNFCLPPALRTAPVSFNEDEYIGYITLRYGENRGDKVRKCHAEFHLAKSCGKLEEYISNIKNKKYAKEVFQELAI